MQKKDIDLISYEDADLQQIIEKTLQALGGKMFPGHLAGAMQHGESPQPEWVTFVVVRGSGNGAHLDMVAAIAKAIANSLGYKKAEQEPNLAPLVKFIKNMQTNPRKPRTGN